MIHERVRAWSGVSVVRVSALGVAAVLVLAGCSDDGGPGAEAAEVTSSSAASSGGATASASASPTPTPTPTVAAYKPASADGPAENVPLPVMPELAKQESKEGLEAFAEYWYQLANYGYETGDVQPLRAVTADTCTACDGYYRVVTSGYAGNDWMLGSLVTLQDVSSNFVKTKEGYYQVTTLILQEELEYYAPEGFLGSKPGNNSPVAQLIEASFTAEGWRLIILETIDA
jgi:hypothetical protein